MIKDDFLDFFVLIPLDETYIAIYDPLRGQSTAVRVIYPFSSKKASRGMLVLQIRGTLGSLIEYVRFC